MCVISRTKFFKGGGGGGGGGGGNVNPMKNAIFLKKGKMVIFHCSIS